MRWFKRFALACLWRAWRVVREIALLLFLMGLTPEQRKQVLYIWGWRP